MINPNLLCHAEPALYANVVAKTRAFLKKHPNADIISLSMADVTLPLPPTVVDALSEAAADMSTKKSFRGYGPTQGYRFLRDAVAGYYESKGVKLSRDEVVISDGAKGELCRLLELFSPQVPLLLPTPTYALYADIGELTGRRVIRLPSGTKGPDKDLAGGLIYLCSPNNPTGVAYTAKQLRAWVDFANANGSVILFDATYEAFVAGKATPRSIFEIPGARRCAIEICSFSKTAGFSGLRCGYTVIPRELERDGASVRSLCLRHRELTSNGVSYPAQLAAAAVLSPEGQAEYRTYIDYYKRNAKAITEVLDRHGVSYTGGKHSPYIWMRCPDGMSAWQTFDKMLEKAHVVATPGVGYGEEGEGYVRLSAFGESDRIKEACRRLDKMFAKMGGTK